MDPSRRPRIYQIIRHPPSRPNPCLATCRTSLHPSKWLSNHSNQIPKLPQCNLKYNQHLRKLTLRPKIQKYSQLSQRPVHHLSRPKYSQPCLSPTRLSKKKSSRPSLRPTLQSRLKLSRALLKPTMTWRLKTYWARADKQLVLSKQKKSWRMWRICHLMPRST